MLSYILSNAICAVVIISLWVWNRRRSAGLGFWVADFVMQFCAVLLIGLRGIVPVSASILLGSPLVIGGTILLYMGLERYLSKITSPLFNYLFFAAFSVFHVCFAFVWPSLSWRNVGLSVALLVVCGQCAWLLLRRVDFETRPATRATGVAFVIYSAFSLARIAVDLVVPQGNDVFSSGLYDTLVILGYQMLFVGLTFSLSLMVNRRLFGSLERDVEERELIEGALRRSERQFALAFQTSPYAITITRGRDGKLIEVNEAFSKMTGFTREEAIGRLTNDLGLWVEEQERDRVAGELLSGGRIVGREILFRRRDGGIITGSFSAAVMQLNDEPCLLSSIGDITERKRVEQEGVDLHRDLLELKEQLQVQATTDSLTGMLNRRALLARMEVEMARTRRSKQPFTVSMLDIDHFKQVNDVHGHAAGGPGASRVREARAGGAERVRCCRSRWRRGVRIAGARPEPGDSRRRLRACAHGGQGATVRV